MTDGQYTNLHDDPEYVWTGCECGDEHECGIEAEDQTELSKN